MTVAHSDYRTAQLVVRAPSLAPTVLITLLFGVFGLIPAHFAAKRATALGFTAGAYMHAFRITLAVAVMLFILLGVVASLVTPA